EHAGVRRAGLGARVRNEQRGRGTQAPGYHRRSRAGAVRYRGASGCRRLRARDMPAFRIRATKLIGWAERGGAGCLKQDTMEKITADEAARLVQDGDAILISGSGGGHSVPEALLAAVERRFLAEGKPRGITSVSIVGVGDRAELGATHLAHEGLLRRAITSALVDSPGLVRLAAEDKIEAYTLPQGVLSQLMRDMAAGRPGLVTKTGLHSFVDPRQQGARQSPRTPPDFVEVVNLVGEEWLLFKPIPITVAFLRGTT